MATYARLSYNGKVQTVALIEGLQTDELVNLLKTVFSVEGTIVGLVAEKGLVLPISLVSRSPSVVPNTVCKLLVSNNPTYTQSSERNSNPVSLNNLPANVEGGDSTVSEEDSSEVVTQEIIEFIDGLKSRNFLNEVQSRILKSLLQSNSTLLFAAYSVAISANDSEYLAEICKDLAQSLMSEQGRSACEAQDEVLQVADQLYVNSRITENQLLYLRHLVLIREEEVAQVYDDFQDHQSVQEFAKALFELCNTHPYSQVYGGEKSTAKGSTEAEKKPAVSPSAASATSSSPTHSGSVPSPVRPVVTSTNPETANARLGLSGVLSLMMRGGLVSSTEGSILLDLIRSDNEYVLAAYELFETDQNIEELKDTLRRCAKLEVRKRTLDAREKELQRRSEAAYDAQEDATEDDEERDTEDESEQDAPRAKPVPKKQSVSKDDEGEKDEDNDSETPRFGLEDISLDSILEVLDVTNIWENSVPEQFIKIVFIAVIRKQLDTYQAKALCDLFHANYDLVRAAWEVFSVQEDTVDFLDTLRRIVKDLTVDTDDDDEGEGTASEKDEEEQRQVQRKPVPAAAVAPAKPASKPASASATSAQAPPAISTPSNGASSASSSAVAAQQAAVNAAQASVASVENRKKEALEAVNAAKRDLLKHSLEMMVKQGLIKADAAVGLLRRFLYGDQLTEAAIDAYAQDRNVSEFLDTLQILASHTPEELNELMNNVPNEEEEEEEGEEEGDNNNNQKKSASTNTATATADAANKPPTPPAASTSAGSNKPKVPASVAIAQLKGIVTELVRNDMINGETQSSLTHLINSEDPRLFAAFQQFVETQQGANLIDTLLRIAAADITARTKNSPSKQQTAAKPVQEESESEEEEEEDDESPPSAPSAGGLLSVDDQRQVIEILARASALTPPQVRALNDLVSQGQPTVRRIFRQYETDKNVHSLIDNLKSLNLDSAVTSNDERGDSDSDGEEEDQEPSDEGEGDDEDDEDTEEERSSANQKKEQQFDEDDALSIEQKFLHIVQRMQLSHLETAALRLAIARDDPSVRRAIEQFRVTVNEQILMAALKNIALTTIQETMDETEEEGENEEEQDQDDDEEDDEPEDEAETEEEGDEEEDERDDENQREIDELIRKYSAYNTNSSTASAPTQQTRASPPKAPHSSPPGSATKKATTASPSSSSAAANNQYKSTASPNSTAAASHHNNGRPIMSSLSASYEARAKSGAYDYKLRDSDDDESEVKSDEEEEEESEEESEEDDDDDEDEEEGIGGTSLITSQAARNHVFPILVQELVKENILTAKAGQTVLKQFQENSPLISAAIDMYDRDSDLASLVQTLQSAVDRVRQ